MRGADRSPQLGRERRPAAALRPRRPPGPRQRAGAGGRSSLYSVQAEGAWQVPVVPVPTQFPDWHWSPPRSGLQEAPFAR